MNRDTSAIKRENAEVYYRDKVRSGHFDYVKGVVVSYKSVADAEKDWNQHWKRGVGTILEIAPKDNRVENPDKLRYRHLSSVLNTKQYEAKQKRSSQRKKEYA